MQLSLLLCNLILFCYAYCLFHGLHSLFVFDVLILG